MLCQISVSRVRIDSLTLEKRKEVIWELTDRIINVSFGSIIQKYRSDRLRHVNQINFRTEIAVKSKKKNNN